MQRSTFLKMGLTGIITALSKRAWALNFYPKQSDKKWAILYGTWCGSSRDAGIWISEGLGGIADVFDIRENPDMKGFDHIIIGSSIRGFKIHPLIEEYISANKTWLSSKIRGFWAVCNNMGQTPGKQQEEMYIDNIFRKISGVKNAPGMVFHGRITKDLLEKEVAGMFQSFPDNDNLKRSDCLAFGKKILASVKK